MLRIFLNLLFLSTFGASLAAREPIQLIKLQEAIVFDGIPNEAAWSAVSPFPLVTHMPTYGTPATERTDILLAYDDEYIYLAGRLYDKEPDKIAANSKKRDAMVGNTDWFGIVLDTYNDKENALAFFTNPNALRLDVNVFNDAIGDEPMNISWNTFWDVKTQRNEQGWFVEMRIPFASIQFQPKNGKVTMGVITYRYIARKNEINAYPDIRPDFGDFSLWKPSLAQEVQFENIEARRPIYIAPYILAGHQLEYEQDETDLHYDKHSDPKIEAGLDLKYGLTKNITLDVSVNTDFAQVEADDQQVNLTRFSLFFPEKRLFFQERSGIFNYAFGSRDFLFYSRRIGINDDGELARIYGGARVVGRAGLWDFGLMNMQTAADGDTNGENFTILRIKKQVINENSDLGGILTNRMDFDGNYNTTYGLDATIRVYKNDFLSLRWAQTFANDQANQLASFDPTRYWISLSRRQFTGFTYGFSFSRSGEDFNPAIGFQGRDNFTRLGSRLTYGWLGSESSILQRYSIVYRGSGFWSNKNKGVLDIYSGSVGWEFFAKTGYLLNVGMSFNHEYVDELLEFTDEVSVEEGTYDFSAFTTEFSTPQNAGFYLSGQVQAGKFYDGRRLSVLLSPYWALSPSLELGVTYEFNKLNFPDRNLNTNLHITRIKGLFMLSTKFSISSFLQYNSTAYTFTGNIRLRYNPSEGNDLYIVFNDDLNTNRERDIPVLPKENFRSILLKYTYTFRI